MNYRAALWVALPAALWLGASAMFQGLDTDFFWHAKVGALGLAGLRPEAAEPLSWTAAGRYWLDHEWLGERAWAWLLAHAGLGAIRVLHALLLAALLGLVVRLQREEGAPLPAAAWSALLVGGLLFPWYLPRLQVFTGIGLALTLLLLQRWAAGGLRAWMAPAYGAWVVLWANLHGGGAILGPMALTLGLAVEGAARRWRPGPSGLRWVAAAAALGWLALLVNPAGPGLPVFSLAAMLDPRIQQMNAFVVEWKGFNPASPFYLLYAAWTVAVVAGLALARRAPRPGVLAVGLALAAMAYGSYRNIPLAAIATAPAWGAALAGLGRRPAFALGTALAGALFTLHPALHAEQFGQLGERMPSPAALEALRQQGAGRKLLNWYSWGGEIGFACAPGVKVFIDGRQYVFGPQVNEDYIRLATAAPGHEAIVERYQLDAAFFPPEWPILKALHRDPAWRTAYRDGTAELMLRAPR